MCVLKKCNLKTGPAVFKRRMNILQTE